MFPIFKGLTNVLKNTSRRWTTTVAIDAQKAGTAESVPRIVGWWMGGIAGMCFGAVVLGGVTRLTESGLSMVITFNFIFWMKSSIDVFFIDFRLTGNYLEDPHR